MPHVPVLGFLALGGIAAAIAMARMIKRTARPTTSAAGARTVTPVEWFAEGEVGRVRGIVVADGPTYVGPLSGRTCVGYELTVRLGAPGADDAEYAEVIREVRWHPFAIDDGTGRALVRFEGDAHLTLGVVATEAGGADAVEADERAILDRHQQPALRHGRTPELRFRERAIAVGELISVTGRGVREADPSPRAAHLGRGAPPTRLVLHPTAGQPLVLSTDPGDLND